MPAKFKKGDTAYVLMFMSGKRKTFLSSLRNLKNTYKGRKDR